MTIFVQGSNQRGWWQSIKDCDCETVSHTTAASRYFFFGKSIFLRNLIQFLAFVYDILSEIPEEFIVS